MNTDPIPRGGQAYYPTKPEATKNADTLERRAAEEAMPFLDGVIAWFDEVIEQTDSNKLVRVTADTKQVSHEVASVAFDLVRELLEDKREEFIAQQATFAK